MEGGDGGDKVCGHSTMTALLLQNDRLSCDSLWIPTSSSATLHGAKSLVNFENVGGETGVERPFFQQLVKEENGDVDYDACINPRGKKRRLSPTQVQFLEKTFGVENKLEPEKKMQIAKELGLQPRQVAIWFQNRRARFKNKQLEKDYDSLRACYDKLMADYDNLIEEKENLKTEVLSLKEKLLSREKGTENLEPFNAINSPKAELELTPNAATENVSIVAPLVKPKQEDASSAKSDVSDSDSPNSFLEPADSPRIFEPDQSDFSQDKEENLSRSFLHPPNYPKLYHDPPASSCNFGFPVEDQPFWSWTY